jgi:hypothetical protein
MEEVKAPRRASGKRDACFGGSDMDPRPPMTSGIICGSNPGRAIRKINGKEESNDFEYVMQDCVRFSDHR